MRVFFVGDPREARTVDTGRVGFETSGQQILHDQIRIDVFPFGADIYFYYQQVAARKVVEVCRLSIGEEIASFDFDSVGQWRKIRGVRKRKAGGRDVCKSLARVRESYVAAAAHLAHFLCGKRFFLAVRDHLYDGLPCGGVCAVPRAERQQRVRVALGRAPVRAYRLALFGEVQCESGKPGVFGVDVHQREQRERSRFHVFHGQHRRKLHRAGPVAGAHERASEPGAIEGGQLVAAVEPVQLPVQIRRARKREVVAGVDARGCIRGHCPLAHETFYAFKRFGGDLEPGRLRLYEELRRPQRDRSIPRRVVAIGPHREVVGMDHRQDAPDSRVHGPLRICGDRGLRRRQQVEHAACRNEREHARDRLLKASVGIGRKIFERGRQFADGAGRYGERAVRDFRHDFRRVLEGVRFACGEAHRLRCLHPRGRGTHRQVDDDFVPFAESLGYEHEASFARNVCRDRYGKRFRRAVGKFYLAVGDCAGRERRSAVYAQGIGRCAVLAAAVREHERRVELVARSGEARRVRLHYEVGRYFLLHRAGASRARVVGDCRHAHLARELRQFERNVCLPVFERNVERPSAQRLEAAAWNGADAAEKISVRAAAGLYAGTFQFVAYYRQKVVEDVVERMAPVARCAEPASRVWSFLVREDVYSFVDNGDGGEIALDAVQSEGGHVRDEVASAAGCVVPHVRRHAHVERAVARGGLEGGDAPRAVHRVALRRLGGLHHADCNVHSGRPVRRDRLERDFRRGVSERDYLRID